MPGDYSRRTFDPTRDVAVVFEQQGRVRLDADVNELVEVLDRRLRATSLDTLGPAVVPIQTPDGFAIALGSGGLTIGSGRAYVDGVQVDNHGHSLDGFVTPAFDAGLEEVRGTEAMDWTRQPYLPVPTSSWAVPPPTTGKWVAYLDVWHRERTWVEDPRSLDPALYGIDTSTRRQTIWQVKLLQAGEATDGGTVDCATPGSLLPGWDDVSRPSASRLTTAAVGVPASTDPCQIPPNGGFRGVENRLYRAEIHDGGAPGTATWKWSRDNASIAAPVTAMSGAQLVVERLGRDNVLRFATGDWIEISDDDRELIGQPGELAKVLSVDETRDTVVLTAPLTGTFNTAAPTSVATRIRRWDQVGAGPTGLFTVGAGPTVLEDGVQVTFTLDPDIVGGSFRTGEHWVFAARVADGSVEVLDAAPPVSPHHHVARLAVVDFDAGSVADCRVMWPPPFGGGGDCGCECDFCVTALSHNSGAFTIYEAVKQALPVGGVICLGAGVYRLRDTVVIAGATSVTIRGKGWRTIVLTPGNDPAFLIDRGKGVTVEDLMVIGSDGRFPQQEQPDRGPVLAPGGLGGLRGRCAVAVSNSLVTTISRCTLVTQPILRRDRTPTLATLGAVLGLTVNDCTIVGTVAIGNPLGTRSAGRPEAGQSDVQPQGTAVYLPSAPLEAAATDRQRYVAGRLMMGRWAVHDNVLIGGRAGVALVGPVMVAFDDRFSRNDVLAGEVGMAVTGIGLTDSLVFEQNMVVADGVGIATGVEDSRIEDNIIHGADSLLSRAVLLGLRSFAGDHERHLPLAKSDPNASAWLWPETVQVDLLRTTVSSGLDGRADVPRGLWTRAGILVLDGLGMESPLQHVRITGNEVQQVQGIGIFVATSVQRSLVQSNRVGRVALAGIVVLDQRAGTAVVVENTVDLVGAPGGRTVVGIGGGGGDDDPDCRIKIESPYDSGTFTRLEPASGLGAILVGGGERAEVRDNQVAGVVAGGHGRAFGIQVDGSRTVRVSGNRVEHVGADGTASAGVRVVEPLERADVFDNDVVDARRGESIRWTGVQIDAIGWSVAPGLYGVESALAGHLVRYMSEGQSRSVYVGVRLRAVDDVRQLVAVRGNAVVGGGVGPLVLVSVRGLAQLADNRVRFDGASRTPIVLARAERAIVDANYVHAAENRDAAASGVAIEVEVDPVQVTVLGNITEGRIIVDGSFLAPPWQSLNVIN